MIVRDCHTIRVVDVETGAISFQQEQRWLDISGVLSDADGQAATAQLAQRDANAQTLQDQAATALDNLRAYRDLAAPTNAQTVAAVKLLCRVAIGLIRLRLEKFEALD